MKVLNRTFKCKTNADMVLAAMTAQIEFKGKVTIADYYGYLGCNNCQKSDNEWGWTDLRDAKITKDHNVGYIDGFTLSLPIPIHLSGPEKMKEENNMEPYEKAVFLSREDAEKVAKKMLEYRVKYGKVTLYDYHDMCGHIAPMDYTRYGWVDFKKIDVRFSSKDGGYILDLPEPICLDTAEVDDKPGVEKYCPYLPYTDSGDYLSKPGSYTITKFPLCIGDACMAYEDGRCMRCQ